MSEETISEEQVLHNKLSFEINQELIHLMKRIIEIQQENQQLKEVIDQIREYIKNSSDMSVVNNYSFPDKPVIDKRSKKDLLQILDKVKNV